MMDMVQDSLEQQRTSRDELCADQLMETIFAAESGDVSKIAALLERHPELAKIKNERESDDPYRQPGATALHYAAWTGQTESAALLISYGADINLKDDSYNDTPLGWANENHQDTMIDFLISRGAAMSMGDAARTGKIELVKAFIALDSTQVDLGKETSWRPLFSAAGWGHKEVVELLLDHGAEVNGASLFGNTALHSAVGGGYTEIIKLLLARGANTNVQTQDGTTPLHRAAWQRQTDMVKLLMENGADPHIKETNGYTTLDLAVAKEGAAVKDWGEAGAVDAQIVRMLT
jgi:ankyrin repeat protein